MDAHQTLQLARLREHLEALREILEAGAIRRGRGLVKADAETAYGHANAARAHLKSLEIAVGIRPISAALVDDDAERLTSFDAALGRLLEQLGDEVETWTVKAELGDAYEIAGPKPGLYRATAAGAEMLEPFPEDDVDQIDKIVGRR